MASMKKRSLLILLGVLAGVAVLGAGVGAAIAHLTRSPARPQASNPLFVNTSVDPGTSMSRPAPNFTLTDQFGRRVSLRSFRGKVVLLAFNDPVCTTICPLTTTAMVEAKRLLGAAGVQVELLGISANPEATGVRYVRDYSRVHRMLNEWDFLTGSLSQLKRVWNAYGIAAQVINDEIDHTPALYVIDRRGRLRKLYLTQMAYAGVRQQARILAEEASALLPGHPPLSSRVSYGQAPLLRPTAVAEVPRAGGGTVRLGPGQQRLYLFFATWLSETTNLRAQLEALDRYQTLAKARGLPQLTAVDEASVEPSSGALPRLLASLHRPLTYPVAIDVNGRVADGYRVQDQPWLTLVSRSGRLLWYHDVSAAGWLGTKALAARVQAALIHAGK
jgi:cytochrome oxidase Cu insertion factor (SCO1/SenC/PrrC family)